MEKIYAALSFLNLIKISQQQRNSLLIALDHFFARLPQYDLDPDLNIEMLFECLVTEKDLIFLLRNQMPILLQNWQRQEEKREALQIKLGAKIDCVLYGQSSYPQGFRQIQEPPLIFYVMGGRPWQTFPLLSVVGSRDIRPESELWMDTELAHFLQEHKWCVVSGGARGVDQGAHRIAVQNALPTIVVLPCGLEKIYPSNLQEWIKPILSQGGCFISEYPLALDMHKRHFVHRNRLIAGFSLATLIVQASLRSGTLLTAALCADCNRPVLVVPGHPTQFSFAGNLRLLQEGGALLANASDLSAMLESELSLHKNFSLDLGHFHPA